MAVWKLKNCPQCKSELFIQREKEIWYESCVLCGYSRDISNLVAENAVGQIKLKYQIEASRELPPNAIVTDKV